MKRESRFLTIILKFNDFLLLNASFLLVYPHFRVVIPHILAFWQSYPAKSIYRLILYGSAVKTRFFGYDRRLDANLKLELRIKFTSRKNDSKAI
ncbi:MAG: hypothetical protein LBU04_07040, partial [Christensenellaceae bacterium]|nr:hypothetical protein [Christensenellaceae bacterium]